jgi:hypothetical protein
MDKEFHRIYPKIKSWYHVENKKLHYFIFLQNSSDVLEIYVIVIIGFLRQKHPLK